MKYNLTEQTRRKIKKNIPRMAKDIHENRIMNALGAIGGFIRQKATSGIAAARRAGSAAIDITRDVGSATGRIGRDLAVRGFQAGKESLKRDLDAVRHDQRMANRQLMHSLDSRYARHFGMSTQDFRRLHYEVPDTAPTPPPTHVRDPSGQLIANPHYAAMAERHKSDMEDYQKKQQIKQGIASINQKDRTLGRSYESIFGYDIPDPRNRTTGTTRIGGKNAPIKP